MRLFVAFTCLALVPVWLAAPPYVFATTIEPDKTFTFESSERNVENLYRLAEEILIANAFWTVRRTPAVEFNESSSGPPWDLPPAASPEKGVIFATFKDKTGANIYLMVDACRIRLDIVLPERTESSSRELMIASIAKFLIDGLCDRAKGRSEFIDGYGRRSKACISE